MVLTLNRASVVGALIRMDRLRAGMPGGKHKDACDAQQEHNGSKSVQYVPAINSPNCTKMWQPP